MKFREQLWIGMKESTTPKCSSIETLGAMMTSLSLDNQYVDLRAVFQDLNPAGSVIWSPSAVVSTGTIMSKYVNPFRQKDWADALSGLRVAKYIKA